MSLGTTHASNCSAVTSPSSTAVSFSCLPSLWAVGGWLGCVGGVVWYDVMKMLGLGEGEGRICEWEGK